MASPTYVHEFEQAPGVLMDREAWRAPVLEVTESQTIKKTEGQRTDAFKQWFWRRLLRVLWTARRSKQSVLKEISPEYSLEGLMLKLKPMLWSSDANN